MQRGFPYLQGNPVLPYKATTVDAGSDCWLELQFLDRTRAPAVPTTITYRIDNVTDNQVVLATTSVAPSGTTMELNIPASLNVMQRQGQSSQINQVTVVSTYSDGSTRTKPFFYELIAICTVGGA
jgi:hypothetical protein